MFRELVRYGKQLILRGTLLSETLIETVVWIFGLAPLTLPTTGKLTGATLSHHR